MTTIETRETLSQIRQEESDKRTKENAVSWYVPVQAVWLQVL